MGVAAETPDVVEVDAEAALDNVEENEVLLGSYKLMLVGMQHYRGVIHEGEYVNLVREPFNPYDRNAIRVDNMDNIQVGHIKRELAYVLSKLMDDANSGARLEAITTWGGNRFQNPCELSVFGPPERANAITSRIAALPPATRGGGPARAGNTAGAAARVVTSVSVVDPVKSQQELDEIFDKLLVVSEEDAAAAVKAGEDASQLLNVPLFPHQKEGLAYMLRREKNPDPSGLPPFWEARVEQGRQVWFNTITNSSSTSKPESVRGGILADEMGLGKTLQVLALMLVNPPTGVTYAANGDTETAGAAAAAAPAEMSAEEKAAAAAAAAAAEEAAADAAASAAFSALPTATIELLAELQHMKVANLKSRAKEVGAPVSGTKDVLVHNILKLSGKPVTPEAYAGSMETPAKRRKVLADIARTQKERAATAAIAAAKAAAAANDDSIGRATLIVCPMSVLANWETQALSHIRDGALRVCTYHGAGRAEMFGDGELGQMDLVITTYGTLAAEFDGGDAEGGGSAVPAKRKRGASQVLLSTDWHRVVLDEAHVIRNPRTKMHKACAALKTRRRWCVTGTPLQNKPADIGSLLSFLQLPPVSDAGIFKRSISGPIMRGDLDGLSRLRVLLRSLCLRRTMALLADHVPPKTIEALLADHLPPKTIEVHTLKLDEAHRETYDVLHKSASTAFKLALSVGEGAVMSQYSSVLECLLRLRQACLSRSLIDPERIARAKATLAQMEGLIGSGKAKGKKSTITAEKAKELFDKLRGVLQEAAADEGGECAVCLEPLAEEQACVLQICGHAFCTRCLEGVAGHGGTGYGGGSKCPLCRAEFTKADIVTSAQLKAAAEKEDQNTSNGNAPPDAEAAAASSKDSANAPPPKVASLLQALQGIKANDASEKSVVFSQFTGFLDVIERHLVAAGFKCARLDGKCSANNRRASLKAFSEESGPRAPTVMLVSLMAGGTGITLTAANNVFLMDLWWNGSVEDQAMDRVHRIGQKKPVKVIRFITEDTLEPKILEMQESKKVLGTGALNKLSAEEIRKARLGDLITIFG